MFSISAITADGGTAGLPHDRSVFYGAKSSRCADQRAVGLLFIALLYTTAPAIAVFARYNLMESVRDASWSVSAETNDDPSIKPLPEWVRSWEDIGLIAWVDKDGDGAVDYARGGVRGQASFAPDEARGDHGERVLVNEPTDAKNGCMWTVTSWSWPTQKFLAFPIGWWPGCRRWFGGGPLHRGGFAGGVDQYFSRPARAKGCFPIFLKRESCAANCHCGCGGRGGLVGD